jgi:alanine racemase
MSNRSTYVHINSDALRSNIQIIKDNLPEGTAIMAMVKANAYGHGIIECSKIAQEEGIDFLGIAFASEGVMIRKAGITMPIILMTPPEPEELDALIEYGIETIICSRDTISTLNEKALSRDTKIPVHVFIDTGMHRDGIMPEETVTMVQTILQTPGLHWKGICTHFATADADDMSFMLKQKDLFTACLKELEALNLNPEFIHIGNSAALMRMPENIGNLARPGLSIYGYSPVKGLFPGLQPILSLHSSVMSIRKVKQGESVSYGRSFIAEKDTIIGTIPIGYGDGLFRGLTGKLQCIINGVKFPIVGNICMDECMVDLGDSNIQVGSIVTFIGNDNGTEQSAEDLASLLNTIPYEITTAISARVPRIIA